MRDATNDNEKTTFEILAAPTARVTRRLKKKPNDSDDDAQRSSESAEQNRARRDREYIEYRLRELRAFERRASGK